MWLCGTGMPAHWDCSNSFKGEKVRLCGGSKAIAPKLIHPREGKTSRTPQGGEKRRLAPVPPEKREAPDHRRALPLCGGVYER